MPQNRQNISEPLRNRNWQHRNTMAHQPISDDINQSIIAAYPHERTVEIAQRHGVSVAHVKSLAKRLQLKKTEAFQASQKSRPIATSWPESDLVVLREMYADHRAEDIATRLGRSLPTVYAMAHKLGLEKSDAFMNSAASGKLDGISRRPKHHRTWTEEDLRILRERYPYERTEDIARTLGRSLQNCYAAANRYGLRKSEAFLASAASRRLDGVIGAEFRMKKGNVPWNKGLKGVRTGGVATQFKPGDRPFNIKPVGSTRVTADGFIMIKTSMPNKYELLQRVVWKEHHGDYPPPDMMIHFKDGNRQNCDIDNLELVTKRDHILTYTIMRFPKELREVIRLAAKLRRQIHERL